MNLCDKCWRRHWKPKIDKKTGLQVKHQNGNKVFICVYCGHVQEEEHAPTPKNIQVDVLYIDIEYSLDLYYNYGSRVPGKYLSAANHIRDAYMISWVASYRGSNVIWSDVVSPKAARDWNDAAIVGRLHELCSNAPIIAGHNVAGFDLKKINTRFKAHGLPPIVKPTIDTLQIVRKVYGFAHNDLDSLCRKFGINGKDRITIDDWHAAMGGDEKTLQKILKYNIGDVRNGKLMMEEVWPAIIQVKGKYFGQTKAEPQKG